MVHPVAFDFMKGEGALKFHFQFVDTHTDCSDEIQMPELHRDMKISLCSLVQSGIIVEMESNRVTAELIICGPRGQGNWHGSLAVQNSMHQPYFESQM
jgi:hypothetical protein